MEFLLKVEEVFELTGRGCVLDPAIPSATSLHIAINDPLELRRPDGSVIRTHLYAFMHLRPNIHQVTPLVMPPEIKKSDIPVGTEVWLGVDASVVEERCKKARTAARSLRGAHELKQ